MSILNYLMALSLVLLTVVKTAGLFIESNRALESLQDRLVKSTREKIAPPPPPARLGERGSISLTACLLTVLLSSLLLFYITKMKIEYAEAVYRKTSYLCMGYLNVQTKKYIKEMALFNWSLRSAYAARNTVVGGVAGTVLLKALTMARNARHYNYMRKLALNKYCRLPETSSYLKNTPFKINKTLGLITNIDETSLVRETKWDYTVTISPKDIRLKKAFCLKSSFHISDAFFPNPTYQSEEMALVDLSNLKCFFGASS